MSEVMVSGEVEDVLSSIRRLVSDDLRPVPVAAASVLPGGADAGKLLLTPALRVAQGAVSGDAPALDAVLAQVSAGMGQQADEWESETGDMCPDLPSAEIAAETASEIWSDAPPIDAYLDDLDRGAVAAAEDADAEGEGEDQPEAERGEAEVSAPMPGWAQSARQDDEDAPRADPWAGTATAEPDRAWADAAEAAVLRELAGAADGGDEGPEQAEPMAAAMSGAMPGEYDAPPYGTEADEVPVDEAMLREIVREVLREELQGRLGERITGNIRKLVRAEIARMLASEKLL